MMSRDQSFMRPILSGATVLRNDLRDDEPARSFLSTKNTPFAVAGGVFCRK